MFIYLETKEENWPNSIHCCEFKDASNAWFNMIGMKHSINLNTE